MKKVMNEIIRAEKCKERMINDLQIWIYLAVNYSTPMERMVKYLQKFPVCPNGDPYCPESIEAIAKNAEGDIIFLENTLSALKDSYVKVGADYACLTIPPNNRYEKNS